MQHAYDNGIPYHVTIVETAELVQTLQKKVALKIQRCF